MVKISSIKSLDKGKIKQQWFVREGKERAKVFRGW
jgi:hypothetical protein